MTRGVTNPGEAFPASFAVGAIDYSSEQEHKDASTRRALTSYWFVQQSYPMPIISTGMGWRGSPS